MCDYFSKPGPTIKEFKEKFDTIAKECSMDGIMVMSHNFEATVSVTSDDDNDDNMYEIVGIDVDMLGGCGCWIGPKIVIRPIKSEENYNFERLMKKLYPENPDIVQKDNNNEYKYVLKEWIVWKTAKGIV